MNFPPGKIKLLLSFLLFIISINGYTQSKDVVKNLSFATNFYPANTEKGNSIQQVDSIGHIGEAASYFASMYSKIMKKIKIQMEGMNAINRGFIEKFEIGFADYFLNAYYSQKKGELSFTSEWTCFFSNLHLSYWQIILLGVNAHTNADIWQALVNNFTEQEIRQNKKQLLSVQSSIAKVYSPFFDEIMNQNHYLKFINSFTKGVAKITGERLVYKWRKRNIRLAVLFYKNPEKFKRRLEVVKKKKQKNDEIIVGR